MAEEKRIEGEDIVAHLMAQHGTESIIKEIDDYASKQGGRYKWKTGKVLIVQSPVAVANEKFVYTNGFGYMCKIKEVDKDNVASNISHTPLLTDIQLRELLGALKAGIPEWIPLSDPAAKVLEGLIINVDVPKPFKDKETGEEKTKVRFEIERGDTFNRKVAEARDLADMYTLKQKKVAENKQSTPSSGKVEDTVLGKAE